MPSEPKDMGQLEKEVARRLRDAGARPQYVRRMLEELRDHREEAANDRVQSDADFTRLAVLPETDPSIEDALGSAEMIVEAALSDPRVLQWARRKPWVVFGMLPLISTPLVFMAIAVSIIGSINVAESLLAVDLSAPRFAMLHAGIRFIVAAATYALPAALAFWFCLLAHRARTERHWALLTALILALLSVTIMIVFEAPIEVGDGSLSLEIKTTGWFSRLGRAGLPTLTVLTFLAIHSKEKEPAHS